MFGSHGCVADDAGPGDQAASNDSRIEASILRGAGGKGAPRAPARSTMETPAVGTIMPTNIARRKPVEQLQAEVRPLSSYSLDQRHLHRAHRKLSDTWRASPRPVAGPAVGRFVGNRECAKHFRILRRRRQWVHGRSGVRQNGS